VGLCSTFWPPSEYRWRPLLKMTRSESFVIPFLLRGRKVWLTQHNVACAEPYLRTKWHFEFWSIQQYGHNRHRPKINGLLCPLWAELGSHLTQCGLGRHVPPYQIASWSIQLFDDNRHGPNRWAANRSVVTCLNLDSQNLDSHKLDSHN